MIARKLIALPFIAILTACASHDLKQEPILPNTQQAQTTRHQSAQAITSWQLSGALAARNANHSLTAAMNWKQQGAHHYQIHLTGPLGGGNVMIETTGSTITYTDGTKHVSANNADRLLQQQTGVRLPVRNLYYWVRGLTAPGAITALHNDAKGQLISLSQAGYTINYADYTEVQGIPLPSKIRLQGQGVNIKLVIKHWQF